MSRVIAAFAQFFDGTGAPLENGWLTFYETSTNNTYKPTYADADQTIANENPLQLDAEGRCPNVFGQGLYRVVLSENNPVTNVPGAMIQTFDPVTAQYVNTGNGSGNFGNFDIAEIYQVGQVVLYTGIYYRSLVANNVGYQPDLNTDKWEVIEFLRYWNADVTYLDGNPVFYESELYFSLSDNNIGNQPDINPVWWRSTKSTVVNFEWSAIEVYEIGNIVYYSGVYYRSIIGSNVNNQPDINLDNWEIIEFLRIWNDSVDYNTNDLVIYSGDIYVSLTSPNINRQPDVSPSYWRLYPFSNWTESGTALVPIVSGYNLGSTSNLIGNFYQGNSSIHFFGDTQQASIYHDLTDLYIEETSGDLIIGTESPGTGSIFFKTAGVNKWSIAAQGRLVPESNNLYDIGSASRNVMDFFQGDNANHYFGNSQDVSLFFDGTDFNLAIGSNVWKLLTAGHLQPQTDATFDIGDASHRVKRLFISDDASTDYEAVNRSFLNSQIDILNYRKNILDNGNFEIWQRAISSAAASGVFIVCDRFRNVAIGTGSPTIAISRQSLPVEYAPVPNNSNYYHRAIVVSGTANSDNAAYTDQAVIDVTRLSGKTYTISLYMRADSNKNAAISMNQEFGSGGSATVQSYIGTMNLTANFQRFDFTFTIPSIVSKSIGTGSQQRFRIWYSAGSNFDSITGSLGEQSGTFDIADIQLEHAPRVSDFEMIDFNDNLWRCMAYYQKTYNYATLPGTASILAGRQINQVNNVTNAVGAIYTTWTFARPMWSTPSITIYSNAGNSGFVDVIGGEVVASIIASERFAEASATDSAASVFRSLSFHATADTGI